MQCIGCLGVCGYSSIGGEFAVEVFHRSILVNDFPDIGFVVEIGAILVPVNDNPC